MPEGFLDVALIAMYGKTWALEENYQRLERYVREAADNGAQLIIAPETVLDGYICGKCEKDPGGHQGGHARGRAGRSRMDRIWSERRSFVGS